MFRQTQLCDRPQRPSGRMCVRLITMAPVQRRKLRGNVMMLHPRLRARQFQGSTHGPTSLALM
eukprot:4710927-Pleurochrysis_carterae.AAC.1